jgi:hypothetical protein
MLPQYMSPKSAERFWDNDMHKTRIKARHMFPLKRDAL